MLINSHLLLSIFVVVVTLVAARGAASYHWALADAFNRALDLARKTGGKAAMLPLLARASASHADVASKSARADLCRR
jgi:hypothetical protein